MPHRCAFGCKDTNVVMHVFPNPRKFPERFKTWVNLVKENLRLLSDEDVYRKKRICDIHFIDGHKNRNKRLNTLAIPKLFLPDLSVTREPLLDNGVNLPTTAAMSSAALTISEGIPHIVPASAITAEHNYSLLSRCVQQPKQQKNIPARRPVYSYTQTKSLRTKINYLHTVISRLRKRELSYKERLANAEKLSKDVSFQQVTKQLTKPAQLFAHMQLQTKKAPKGRRFNIEEKVLALSMFKKSPKCYRLLCHYFTLPSTRTMKKLISQIIIKPGINTIVFEKIKKTMSEKGKSDRLCSLMFDEMSITPQVGYNSQKDELEGFASNQETLLADHVLVFMVKGVKCNFKQPIAYYFTQKLNKIELKAFIKTVIQHAFEAGLIIVNTVCDQSPVNVSAITELVNETKAIHMRKLKEWRYDRFRVNGHDIIPLYDTPHLIKGLRNNLLTKNMLYTTANKEKMIKWAYIQMVYAADKSHGELRLLHKLTEEHVNLEKINKMRVKTATQVFSHSVAVVTEHLTARGDLPEECRQLVDFTLLIDKLFDSLNVSSFTVLNGKIYKGPVKRNSPHHELWIEAKKMLRTIKFVSKNEIGNKIRLTETMVPSVINLIKTIEGMEALWKVLNGKYRLDAMLTRNFNQDPVENFFGNIRSYGARNIAPNTAAFQGAFKALLLNNYNSPHSLKANCEEDTNDCLQTLDFFLKEKINTPDVPEDNEIQFNTEICFDQPNTNDPGQSNYVCGWVLRKCLKHVVKKCLHCRNTILEKTQNRNNDFIRAKEYYINKNCLCYPSESTEKYFKEVQNIATIFLKKNVPKKGLKQKIIVFVDLLLDCPFKCPDHFEELKKYFLNFVLNVIICSWCRSVNRILSGKLSYSGDDEIKIAAQNYFNKHKHFKNRK